MKLSMDIIAHWIRQYEPVATIVSNELTIAGIRLFSYDKTPDRDYLYIGRTSDFVERAQVQEILLVHRKDVISLKTQELEDVFDTVMDAFVFYQKWEQDMLSAFQQENPEQVLIDASREIFGPMFFTTNGLQVTAFSRQYPKNSINRNWDDFWDMGALSVDSLAHMQNGKYMENLPYKWNCEVFYEENVERYPYSMMLSQENGEHQLTGQLTIISERPFEKYQKHLALILKQALCLVAGHEKKGQQGSVIQNLFQSLLQDGQQNKAGIERFYQMQGWDRKRWCVIAILKKNSNSAGSYGYHMRALSIHFPEILFCMNPGEQGEGIVCLLTLEDDRGKVSGNRYGRIYPKEFFDMVRRLSFRWFLSYPCQGLENISIQYQQAKTALKEEKEDYYFCALQDLVGFGKDETLRRLALHPALDRIRAYDRKKSTDYYHMLKVYLQCERERVLTSRKLFVHKNTLVYRLKKMVSLFALQLDEIYEREYLMASFLCLEQEKKAE